MLGVKSLIVMSCIAPLFNGSEHFAMSKAADTTQRYCAYSSDPPEDVKSTLTWPFPNGSNFTLPYVYRGEHVNNTIKCAPSMTHCYWLIYTDANHQAQVQQGCWANTGSSTECTQSTCVPKADNPKYDGLKFCCCEDNFCNSNDSSLYSIPVMPPTKPPTPHKGSHLTVPKVSPDQSDDVYCAFIDISISMRPSDGEPSFVFNEEFGQSIIDIAGSGVIQPDNKTIKCFTGVTHCFSLWLSQKGNQTLLKQGCWINSNHDCYDTSCQATGDMGKMMPQGGRFCCCRGSYCNRNISDTYKVPVAVVTIPDPAVVPLLYKGSGFDSQLVRTVVMVFSPIGVVVILVIVTFLVYRVWLRSRKEKPDATHLMESTSSPGGWELDALKFNTLINGGRYGEVWKGTLGDLDVAIKVFTGNGQKQYYKNEKDVYTLPHMDVDMVPKFYGAEERISQEGLPKYVLVMEYIATGTLTNFLKNNSYDWTVMCKLCKSVASGLAHLHTDLLKGDKLKSAVAHRDLNTRNILVRPNQTCVICDFGFAMQIVGSNYIKNGNQEVAEQSSLNDVGTIRYMPPEVLEGAVNLRDCEASLKQIDVYALGLIFWEIGTRCTDLYQGLPVPEYQLPFQAELGLHPTFEEMTLKVSKNKTRPLFPDVWKDSNQGIRALKETIEDCWDQDGEARLTALCVEERMGEMEQLWSNRQRGVTPKINTTNFQSTVLPVPEKTPQLCNSNAANENRVGLDSLRVQEQNLKNLESISPTIQLPPLSTTTATLPPVPGGASTSSQAGGGRHRMSFSENSVSTATTDTLLSPTEMVRPPPNMSHPATWSMYVNRNNKMLPPHQGQNPTVERNTHKRSDEDLEIQGNTLVNKSAASSTSKGGITVDPFSTPPYPHSPSVSDVILDSLGAGDQLETSLVQNDVLNRQGDGTTMQSSRAVVAPTTRNIPRIPYMQNDMVTEPLVVRPKQSNLQQECLMSTKQSEPKALFGKLFKHPKLPFFKKESQNKKHSSQHPQGATSSTAHAQVNGVLSSNPPSHHSAQIGGSSCSAKNATQNANAVFRQSAGASNLETANQIGLSSAYQPHTQRPTHLDYVPTEVRLDGERATVVRAAVVTSLNDVNERHGTSHQGNQEDFSDSTELKRYVHPSPPPSISEGNAPIVRNDGKAENSTSDLRSYAMNATTNRQAVDPKGWFATSKESVNSAKRPVNNSGSCSQAELSPLLDAHRTHELLGNGGHRPKRPSSLVVKSHMGNSVGVSSAQGVNSSSGSVRTQQGASNGEVYGAVNTNSSSHYVSSPDLSSSSSAVSPPPSVVFMG